MFAIDKFKQQVSDQGLLRGNRFSVKIIPPFSLLIGLDDEAIETYAHAVTLPGRTIDTMERSEYGEIRSVGVKHTHEEASVSFYLSEDARERRYIERWQDLVYNPVTNTYGYYDDYVGKINIELLNHNNKKKAIYTLQEAFPTSISATEFQYDDGTQQSMSVTFKFRKYLKTL